MKVNEPAIAYSKQKYTIEEYFEMEEAIPTLREYVLVDPEAIIIKVYAVNKQNLWELKEYKNINETLRLNSIQVSLALKEIYEGTKIAKTLNP